MKDKNKAMKQQKIRNVLLNNTDIVKNANILYEDLVDKYNEPKYQNAIKTSAQMLDEYWEKNKGDMRSIYLGTNKEIPQYGKDVNMKKYKENIKNQIEAFYVREAAYDLLQSNQQKYFGKSVPFEKPTKSKSDRVKLLDKKTVKYYQDLPFEQQGLYKAIQATIRNEENIPD
jgi:hypothetical protein